MTRFTFSISPRRGLATSSQMSPIVAGHTQSSILVRSAGRAHISPAQFAINKCSSKLEHCAHVPSWHMVRRLAVETTFHPDLTLWSRSNSSTLRMDGRIFDVPEGTSWPNMDCSMGMDGVREEKRMLL